MTREGVGLAPDRADRVVSLLRAAARDLEDAGDEVRGLLSEAMRSSSAPTTVEEVARWARRVARELAHRIERVVALEHSSVSLQRDGGRRQVVLDVRGLEEVETLLRVLSDLGVIASCTPDGDLRARHQRLASLPASVAHLLVRQVPELLAESDGVPPGLRDRANRHLMRDRLEQLDARRRRLVAQLQRLLDGTSMDARGGDPVMPLDRRLLAARVDLETWLAATTLQRRLAEKDALSRQLIEWWTEDELQLIKVDPVGGRAVVARGDLESATHVATIVPGANTTLLGLGRAYTGWMDRLHRVGQRRLDREGKGGRLATVLWLDMDSPSGIVPEAMRSGPAEDAARRLPGFLDGVSAVERELVTTIGHSYGSVVLGRSLAAHEGRLASDQLVALGSPGMGVQRGSELGLREDQRLYASTLPGDPIAAAGGFLPVVRDLGRLVHGPDPRRLSGVETIAVPAHDLEADGSGLERAVERHLQYLDEGSIALGTFADVVIGRHRFADRDSRR